MVKQHLHRQQWCACGKTCRGASNFQQMLELADAGIIVYYRGSQLDETNRDRTVFIIRNNKDVEMSSHDIQKALDPNKISCPRCFHIYKRAQKLFKNISSLAKKETIGICDHCAKLQQTHSTAHSAANRAQCKCKNVITRFLTSEKELDLALAMDAIAKPWLNDSRLKQQSILASRQYYSDENVCKDRSGQEENLTETPFSFVFPKDIEVEPSHQISSLELIRDLQDRDDRKKGTKKVELKKANSEKENEKIKSSKDSTPKSEKKVKEIKNFENLKLQKNKEVKEVEKQKEKEIEDIATSKSQKENKDVSTPKSHTKDIADIGGKQKEKEIKDIATAKSQKETKDIKALRSQKDKGTKDTETPKSQKEKDGNDVEKSKAQKIRKTEDIEKPKPQKEKETKDGTKSESSKKNDDADNLLKQLLSSGDKAKAENERNKKEQEIASQKAKLLAEQKLKELNATKPPVTVKVKSAKIRHSNESGLQLEKESIITFQDKKPDEPVQIIVGQKILKNATSLVTAPEQNEKLPLFFKSAFQEEMVSEQNKTEAAPPKSPAKKPQKELMAAENRQGVIRYALSDRSFIDKGWTKLPTEKVVRKLNVYRMRPAHPEFDWFEHNKNRREILYDSGQKLAEFSDDGRGRWYYRNGKLALDYYNAEETNAQQRYVVYSNGEPDERGRSRPRTVLATFDYSGNGVVFDHNGKIRLKYNQTEGVLLDRSIGPVSHWKWHDLNDPPVLQQVMVDTQVARKDPRICNIRPGTGESNRIRPVKNDEDMLAIEFNNFIKEKSRKLTQNFQPYQIKMKALKINENFSLKILDQASVYLIFRDGLSNIKVNMGMVLDHKEIVDTDTADVGDVSNSMERFPARTDSLAVLQQAVAQAQRAGQLRVRHEQRLHKPTGSLASADRLTAAASRPLPPPLMTNSKASISGPACKCTIRKPTLNNVYYDNRISS